MAAAGSAGELQSGPVRRCDAEEVDWHSVVDLDLPELPALDLDHLPSEVGAGEPGAENEQTREAFAAEAAAIAEHTRSIVWRTPSRDEGPAHPVVREEAPTILATDGDGAPADGAAATTIQGGRERGLILHKLIEEVLTGETAENLPDLCGRAEVLIRTLGQPVVDDPTEGLAPTELADCVVRALSLPEIADLRHRLIPELPVFRSDRTDAQEEATAGIVDAIAFDTEGAPEVVIDWKSDIDLAPETLHHYHDQLRAYLAMTGAKHGLIVAVTSGTIFRVARTVENARSPSMAQSEL